MLVYTHQCQRLLEGGYAVQMDTNFAGSFRARTSQTRMLQHFIFLHNERYTAFESVVRFSIALQEEDT